MRHKRLLIMLFIHSCITFAMSAVNGYHDVTFEEALSEVQKYSNLNHVNIYRTEIDYPNKWVIFVDTNPNQGWPHTSYIYEIPKTVPDGTVLRTLTRQVSLSYPPSQEFVPCHFNQPNSSFRNVKPRLKAPGASNTPNPLAARTYALIISGGVNPVANYERYWNDCSFIYQTLVRRYDVPKENIYPIMSDGTNPGADMNLTTGGFASQSLDLDFDGENEIKLAATKANIQSTLNSLVAKLQKDDHLFIYVIDHGGTDDHNKQSYICLWNQQSLYDYELAEMLTPFTSKSVNVNVVLGQCFSGGFIDNLTKIGCVVATASKGHQSSWACPDIPYDEFVYHWTCAINGTNHVGYTKDYSGSPIDADSDNDGYISMKEAFAYAKAKDRINYEEPQYISTPESVGEELSFDHYSLPSVDLYVKDTPEDTGREPNLTTTEFWKCEDIVIRNFDDSIFEHQNPIYTTDHQFAYIYVKVHNRGKEKHPGGKFMHVYWAQASTAITYDTFKGRELYKNKYPTGGHIENPYYIETLESGESQICKFRWALPNLLADYPDGNFHFCLLARIMDTPYDDGYLPGTFNVPLYNDQAQRNITIIKKEELDKRFLVYVRNIDKKESKFNLEFKATLLRDSTFYKYVRVDLGMSPSIYDAWKQGGFKSQNVQVLQNTPSTETGTVRFAAPSAKLNDITLDSGEFDIVSMNFNFIRFDSSAKTYSFDLIQKDEEGNIVGGETFVVEVPAMSQTRSISITPENEDDGMKLSVNDTGDYSYIKWLNKNGDVISREASVSVVPKLEDNVYTVIAGTPEGEVVTDEISVEPFHGMEFVSESSDKDKVNITLKNPAPEGAEVTITSLIDTAERLTVPVSEGISSLDIDTRDLKTGIYVIDYLINQEVADQKKLTLH